MAWRDEHPGESPVVRYPASGTHSPCQTTLYDVGTTDASTDDGCANDETLPVPTPGVPVSISAPGIIGYANPRATVDGALLCVVGDVEDNALRTFVVVVPTSGEGETVSIDVETNYGTLRADVELPATGLGTTEPAVVTTVATTPVVSTMQSPIRAMWPPQRRMTRDNRAGTVERAHAARTCSRSSVRSARSSRSARR